MKTLTMAAATAVLVLASGCAQMPKQAFNREAATHVRTLVIARTVNQDSYEAAVLGHPAASFGLIGGLIAVADMQAKSGQLTKAIDPAETRLQDRFSDKLAEALARTGYETRVVLLPKDIKDVDVLSFVNKQNTRGDAVLVLQVSGGYWAAGSSTDYQPRLAAAVKVYDLRASTLLYQDTITYGYAAAQSKSVHFPSDAKYRFATIGVLTADPALTREGLLGGIDAVAAQIAEDLKRSP